MQHNKSISITKGIAITLMVVGHSPCPGFLADWIYSFHMPLFFLVSGFLFKEKYFETPKKFVVNKFKGYWWPFVKWSAIFLVFHNLLAYLNLYSETYSLMDFYKQALNILTLKTTEELVGGYWFLTEALFSSLIAFGILHTFHKVYRIRSSKVNSSVSDKTIPAKESSISLLIIGALCVGLILIAFILGNHKILFYIKSPTLLATAFFLAGYLICKMKFRLPVWVAYVVIGFTVTVAILMGKRVSLHTQGPDMWYFVGMAILSILAILSLSEKMGETKIGRLFDFIGSNTLIILTFHFLSFKLVNLGIIFRDGLRIEELSSFPCINAGNSYDWIIYTLVGVGVPLALAGVGRVVKVRRVERVERVGRVEKSPPSPEGGV